MRPTTKQLQAFRTRHGLTRDQIQTLSGLTNIGQYLGGEKPRQMSAGTWLMLVGRVCEERAVARLEEAARRELLEP